MYLYIYVCMYTYIYIYIYIIIIILIIILLIISEVGSDTAGSSDNSLLTLNSSQTTLTPNPEQLYNRCSVTKQAEPCF